MENPQKGRNNGTERANQSSISVEDHTRFRCRFLWLGEGGFWFQCTYNENLTHKHKLNLSIRVRNRLFGLLHVMCVTLFVDFTH